MSRRTKVDEMVDRLFSQERNLKRWKGVIWIGTAVGIVLVMYGSLIGLLILLLVAGVGIALSKDKGEALLSLLFAGAVIAVLITVIGSVLGIPGLIAHFSAAPGGPFGH